MKKTPLSLKILSTVLLLIGLSPCVWSSGYNNSNYKVGDDWKDGTISDRGFSDSASMIGSDFAPEMKLDDVKDLRKYFLKGYLEITPENYEGLLQYSDMYESAFKAYDRGVYVKRWKTSLDTEKLSDLLLAFTNIRQFKVEMIWDRENVDISETISRSVQFFGDLGELTISRCQLTDRGLEDILESLKSPEILKILDIRENRLSDSILPKIRERLIRLIDLKTDLGQAKSGVSLVVSGFKEASSHSADGKLNLSRAVVISPPLQKVPSIPEIARGYEEIYQHFLRGVLIYKPNKENDIGKIELPIASLLNPLESTFDLSRCGDAGQYLSISTGCRREATKSANPTKWEVFITPKFLIEAHKTTTAAHYAPICNSSWTAPFAVIQDYGGWTDINWYWYHVQLTDGKFNTESLYEICCESMHAARTPTLSTTIYSYYDVRNVPRFIFNFSEVEKQSYEEAKRPVDARKRQEEQERAKKTEKLQSVQTTLVERPIQKELSIPAIARGYEDIYQRFLRGVLIYKPNKDNDIGRVELSIASLLNPLESTFDLSRCGDAGQYLSISTGYRRAVKPENSNKWEVFITPKFFVERNVGTTAAHYNTIVGDWTAPFAVIQGGWSDLSNYWYHVTLSDGDLNTKNLYEIGVMSAHTGTGARGYKEIIASNRTQGSRSMLYVQF